MLPRFDEAYDATDSRCKTENHGNGLRRIYSALWSFVSFFLDFSIYMESYANTFFARRIATGIFWP